LLRFSQLLTKYTVYKTEPESAKFGGGHCVLLFKISNVTIQIK